MKLEKGALGKSSVLLSFTGCRQPELARRAAPQQVVGGLRLAPLFFRLLLHAPNFRMYVHL